MPDHDRDEHEPAAASGDPGEARRRNPLRAANVVRAVAIALGTYYALRLLGTASAFVFAGFLGLLFGLNLSAAADFLQRYRIPRGVSAGGIVLLLLAALGGAGALLAPTLREQASSLREQLPKAIDGLERRLQAAGITVPPPAPEAGAAAPGGPGSAGAGQASGSAATDSAAAGTAAAGSAAQDSTAGDSVRAASPSPASGSAPTSGNLQKQLVKQLSTLGGLAGSFLSSIASALTGLFVVLFIAIFYAVEPALYREGVLHLVPHKRRKRIAEALSGTSIVLRRWLVAQFSAMIIVGVLTTVAYLIIGVDAAFALGLIAGLCEFVPFVGPVVAAIPAIGMAAAESSDKAMYVALAALAIQQAEEVLIVPLLMKNNLEMPPILTILAQGAMGLAFGVIGLLVAVPLLAALMVPVKMLYVHDVIGDEVDVDANGPKQQEKQ
jgi:predicted PurR-regulated permease PerM